MLKMKTNLGTVLVESAYALSNQGKESLIWERDGERRLLPKSVIRNAFQSMDSWKEALLAGVIEEIPAFAITISWGSALGLPRGSSRVTLQNVDFHPRTSVVE